MVERRCDHLAMVVRSLLTEEEGANTMVEVVLIIVVAAVFAGVLWKAFFSSNGAVTTGGTSIIQTFINYFKNSPDLSGTAS